MSWSERYAGVQPHPSLDEIIKHLSQHHHGQYKNVVEQVNSTIDNQLPVGASLHPLERHSIISSILEEVIRGQVKSGEMPIEHLMAAHNKVHGDLEGPGGYLADENRTPIVTQLTNSQEVVDRVRRQLTHSHGIKIPDTLPPNFSSRYAKEKDKSISAIELAHELGVTVQELQSAHSLLSSRGAVPPTKVIDDTMIEPSHAKILRDYIEDQGLSSMGTDGDIGLR